MSKPSLRPKRGPKRGRSSKVKLRCAWKGCRKFHVDVKNFPFTLTIDELDVSKARPMAKTCCHAKFCSAAHRGFAKLKLATRRGGREALSPEQVLELFKILLFDASSPWAAVAFLLAIFLGERAGCALKARDSWFANMDTDHPTVSVPRVNMKTTAREVPLDKGFAGILLAWAQRGTGPLRGGCGTEWPHPGQKLQMAGQTRQAKQGQLLFPGRKLGAANRRNFNKAVTARGFHDKFIAAQSVILEQRAKAKVQGRSHVFDDIVVQRISSHTAKKTAVTLLKEQGVATTIVSMLTGTSCRVLDATYYKPSKKSQRAAQAMAFGGITKELAEPVPAPAATPLPCALQTPSQCAIFCVACGKQGQIYWRYCPQCGEAFVARDS